MIELYSPRNEAELAIIKSLLNGEGIDFFVRNDHFGSLEVGLRVELFNVKMIFVHAEQYDRARELISDFLETTKQEEVEGQGSYSTFDKIRMLIEAILFNWIMPGRAKKRKT
jgi:hypothetical protein